MKQPVEKAGVLVEALPYLKVFRGKTFVFKYGGHAMVNPDLRDAFLRDVVLLKHVGIHPVIVHGGGPQIEAVLSKIGVKSEYRNGLRVTDDATMDVVEMVLSGTVNGDLVGRLCQLGGLGVGFSGRDGRMIEARITPIASDLGRVGEVTRVNPEPIRKFLDDGMFIPVIAPVGAGEDGRALNINADVVATEIAVALKAEKLVFLSDVEGVLDKNEQRIPKIDRQSAELLIAEGVISGGMVPKIKSALDAVKRGVGSVAMVDGRLPHASLLEIFTDEGVGTLIA